MATNRADTLDPALLRPGRLDRKIEFPLPSRREKRLIFQTVTGKMNLGPDVDLEDCMSNYICFFLPRNVIDSHVRCFPTRSSVIGRNSVNSSSCWSSRYASVERCAMRISFMPMVAVRKNRYVILPVDFEEAWKVSRFGFVWQRLSITLRKKIQGLTLPLLSLLSTANSEEDGRDARVL